MWAVISPKVELPKVLLKALKCGAPQQRFAEDSPHGWQKPLEPDIVEEVGPKHGPLNKIPFFDRWSALLFFLIFRFLFHGEPDTSCCHRQVRVPFSK